MTTNPTIQNSTSEIAIWRRELHQNPETAFAENWTSDFIAEKLTSFGLPIHRGLAKTGVVATIEGKKPGKAIGIRADIDALDLQEENTFEHKSKIDGKMHACGHDGHTAILLGVAQHFATNRDFAGTIYLVFQPAEEMAGGAKVMMEDGLFEKFPMEEIYALHNRPGLAIGKMSMCAGPMMASADAFDITIQGKGTHAAFPHRGVDPVVVQAQLILAFQNIVSRNLDPLEAAVISVATVHGGEARNVIPDSIKLGGTVRTFSAEIQDHIEGRMRQICQQFAEANEAKIEFNYERNYPALVNHIEQHKLCAETAIEVFGADNVDTNCPPVMGSEDFAYLLQAKKGCYVFLGNGEFSEGGCMVHNPGYDFNDSAIEHGVHFWVQLARKSLAN